MVYQTKGIVLQRIMYLDNKMIVKIYTELYGMRSYLCFRSLRKGRNVPLFVNMSLIEVVAERKNRGNFDYIKEVKILSSLEAVGFDVAKSSISMFLNEILCKVLADAGEDVVMFNFLYTSLEQFISKPFIPDFHLRFLTALMRELGCFPKDNFTSSNMVFSIEKSCFVSNSVGGVEECSLGMYFHHLLSGGLFPVDNAEVIPYIWRNSLLEMIMKYYTFHVTSLLQIRSHEILKTLLHS